MSTVRVSVLSGKKSFFVEEGTKAREIMENILAMPQANELIRDLGNIFRERFAEEDEASRRRVETCVHNCRFHKK